MPACCRRRARSCSISSSVEDGDELLIDVAKDKAGELVKRLNFYRLRAQVEIAEEPALAVAAGWGTTPGPHQGAIIYADPRLAALGVRMLVPKGTEPGRAWLRGCSRRRTTTPSASARASRKAGATMPSARPFPHEALFDQLNGVDFAKGCYVGQEVVSRMEHRGTARKRIVPVEGEAPLPASGTSVEADGVPIGTLGSVSGKFGLAMIRLDRAEAALAGGKTLTAGGVKIALRRPSFARFAVPVAEVPA